jgi:AcrR family transcriptional regulator
MTDTQIELRRPKRADARRNYDNLVTAAREVFSTDGTSAPLEDVAERAGVGIGTLYRHFPTRQALLEAVYVGEIEAMAHAAEALADADAREALASWFRQYLSFAATKRALTEALLEEDADENVLAACRTLLSDAGTGLIDRAQAEGAVRPDVTFMDVARIVSGIAVSPSADDEQKERMLQIVLDGLRGPAWGSASVQRDDEQR